MCTFLIAGCLAADGPASPSSWSVSLLVVEEADADADADTEDEGAGDEFADRLKKIMRMVSIVCLL